MWKHGDQDGCNHQIYYNRGHPGIVTLKVTDGTFTCTETYFGTLTGKGLFADCKRTAKPTPRAEAGSRAAAATTAAAGTAAATTVAAVAVAVAAAAVAAAAVAAGQPPRR